ncbi:malonyl-CoA/methylmalonyl-CoA synthetase [Actinosynnema pretiosum]|nr:malonyl-CoA/methylmalonyl-CoA synthetase [Actinosynnema pretiosum]
MHWAAVTPDAVALHEPDGATWTYRRLYETVRGCAFSLRGQGIGPGDVVCTATADPVAARLLRWSANLAGAVDALLDPALPTAELAARAGAVRAAAVLTGTDLAALVCVGRDGAPGSANAVAPTGPGTPARVLFTTGSTGTARAVLQLAGQLDSAAASNVAGRGITGRDVLLCALPPHHAAGSLFEDSALTVGGGLRLLPAPGSAGLAAGLSAGPATVATVVPALLAGLADRAGGLTALNRLRLLNYAGEAIDAELLRQLLEVYRGRVTRGYGLTEAGPLVSILPDSAHRGATLPAPGDVGVPAPNVEVRVAPGTGELHVRSPHVMAGYLGDPVVTRERLRDGWLATGDIAEWRGGGLRLLGRLGNRIRSGGEWVSLDQVQRCLAEAPGVAGAAVVAIAHPRWGQRPVAFVAVRAGFAQEELRARVAATLARPSWPDRVHVLEELPRTGHGKLDHEAMRRMASCESSGDVVEFGTR